MKGFLRSLVSLCLGFGLIGLVSCQPSTSDRPATPPTTSPASPQPASPPPTPTQPASPITPPPIAPSLTSLTIYTVDSQCDRLIPQTITVPSKSPMEAAVGKVLDEQASPDFEIQGYRVTIKSQNREATIDLRRPPKAKRSFASLSSCEQLALFGSLRKTILENPKWKIKTVRFLDQGKEIAF